MKIQMSLLDINLCAVAVLAIVSGVLFFELIMFVEQLPIFTNLVGFFAIAALYKSIEIVQQGQQHIVRRQIVSLECNFSLVCQEVIFNERYHSA